MFTRARTTIVAVALAVGLGATPALGAPAAPREREREREREPSAATSCRKLPPGKRIVRLNLKPDTNVADLVVWIASVTCKQFILPGAIPATSKTVTIVSPQLLTPEEAYRLFLDALDSVGLTVYRTGAFFRIIEAAKAPRSPVPVVVPGDDVLDDADAPLK